MVALKRSGEITTEVILLKVSESKQGTISAAMHHG